MRQIRTVTWTMTALAAALGPPASANVSPCPSGAAVEATPATLAEQLGAAIAESRPDDMSPEVIERTKFTLLDNLATIAFTARLTRTEPYRLRLAERGGSPEALVAGTGLRVAIEDAAAASAWLIHAAETDDSDFRASLRASPVVMGPALAMASSRRVSGREFLHALAIGYTVLGRLAEPLGPLQPKGYMSSGVWGPSASAAVSAKLLKLDARQSAHAIALAAGAGGGSFQYFYDQTEDKRLVVARAARAGTEAALLACRGDQGARRIFEGQAGLYRNFGGAAVQVDPARLIADFGALEGPLRLYPKFFAASASIIPFLEAWPTERIDPAKVEAFLLSGNAEAARIYQTKLDDYVPPTNQIGAKTNFAFVIALYLLRGSADATDFTTATIADPTIHTLAAKGRFRLADIPVARLELQLVGGRRIVIDPYRSDGSKTEPLMREARMRKYASLTRGILTDRQRERLFASIMALESVEDMNAWLVDVDRVVRGVR